MYRFSKSVPRGYEYLNISCARDNKRNKLCDIPPAQYYHHKKNYSNISPLRNKKKLIEARMYKSPISFRDLNSNNANKIKGFNKSNNILAKFNKINNKQLMKKCKENARVTQLIL